MMTDLRKDVLNFLTPAGSFGRREYVVCHVAAMIAAAWHLIHPSEEITMYAGTAIVVFAAAKRLRDLGMGWDLSLIAGALFMSAWHVRGFDGGSAGVFVILTLHMTATYLLSGLRPRRAAETTQHIRSNA